MVSLVSYHLGVKRCKLGCTDFKKVLKFKHSLCSPEVPGTPLESECCLNNKEINISLHLIIDYDLNRRNNSHLQWMKPWYQYQKLIVNFKHCGFQQLFVIAWLIVPTGSKINPTNSLTYKTLLLLIWRDHDRKECLPILCIHRNDNDLLFN